MSGPWRCLGSGLLPSISRTLLAVERQATASSRIGACSTGYGLQIRRSNHEYQRQGDHLTYFGTKGQLLAPRQLRQASNIREHDMFGAMSAEAIKLEKDILSGRVTASTYLQQEAAENRITLEKIRVSLLAVNRRLRLHSRRTRREIFLKDEPGLARNILRIIWDDRSLWMPLLAGDEDSRAALCHFAAMEGLEDLLVRWLEVDEEPDDWRLLSWRPALLQSIILAMFQQDVDNSATKVLQSFFKVIGRRDAAKSALNSRLPLVDKREIPPIMRVGTTGASATIAREFATGRYHRTDPDLWSRFTRFYAKSHPGIAQPSLRQFNSSVLEAYHPTRPNPAPFLALLRQHLDEDPTASQLDALRRELPINDVFLHPLLQHIQKTLQSGGQQRDADWVEKQLKSMPLRTPGSVSRYSQGRVRRLVTGNRSDCK